MSESPFKNLTIEGSEVPNVAPPKNNIKVSFSDAIIEDYIPAWNEVEAAKGIKYLALIMAQKEGFAKGTRSYRFNNPGNIGNMDNGANKGFKTLKDGIEYQIKFLTEIAKGVNKTYAIGRKVYLKHYYSPEIAKNQKTYQLSPWCPGYKFEYIGQLDQFIKIYSTGARQKNTYLSLIISYFNNLGIEIDEKTTLGQILLIK